MWETNVSEDHVGDILEIWQLFWSWYGLGISRRLLDSGPWETVQCSHDFPSSSPPYKRE